MMGLLGTKLAALAGLGTGSFILGVLPAFLPTRLHSRWPVALSALLCFGAGVLLGTALLHILPDVRQDLPELVEPIFCAGFFLLYLLDELVHCCKSSAGHGSCSTRRNTGETTRLLSARYDEPDGTSSQLCHTAFSEPCVQTPTGRVGLLLALSVHAVIEGLVIGLQPSTTKVLLLVGAVASHKLVVSFCLGMELSQAGGPITKLASEMALYAVGSSVGIAIGLLVSEKSALLSQPLVPVLQAIAGGSLLYVTVCEVLPRERAKWHHQSTHRFAGIVQFLSVAMGYGVILMFSIFFEEHEQDTSIAAG